jgi:hypothetical protein
MQNKRSKAEWGDLLSEHESSDLSVAEFCRIKHIKADHFYYYRGQLKKQACLKGNGFVQATLSESEFSTSAREITLKHGNSQLHMSTAISPSWLSDLLKALR